MNQAHAQLTWWASVRPVLQPYLPLFALIVAIIVPLPTHLARDIDDLLPHRWKPPLAG